MEFTSFPLNDVNAFKAKLLSWANQFETVCYLDSNNYPKDNYTSYDLLIGIDSIYSITSSVGNAFDDLKAFINAKPRWAFGFLTYDLKNEIEKLSSKNPDGLSFPDLHFFEPRYVIYIKEGKVSINRNYPEAFEMYEAITEFSSTASNFSKIKLQHRLSKEEYIQKVEAIRQHIIEGDVYELNFCQEFFAENVDINPLETFAALNEMNKAPFSAFLKFDGNYLLCSSPERFLKKEVSKLISQPIKGTIKKGKTQAENEVLKTQLQNDIKERAENVMIVDLVRNDLTKSTETGSIKVEELFGVYEFESVNHLISTVVAEKRNDVHLVDAIRNAYPMGSMTGAPKVMAMELIEQYETRKRGLFSGSVGYISPEGNFDFNVIIRSILYNSTTKYLSYQAGGAITYDSIPEKEYNESLLKANAMKKVIEG